MARRQKTSADAAGEGPEREKDEKAAEKVKDEKAAQKAKDEKAADKAKTAAKDVDAAPERPSAKDLPAIDPPTPHAEPWPDATPEPMKPVDPPAVRTSRTPSPTIAMPVASDPGKPPDMPSATAPRPLVLGDIENPTHMPGPKDVPAGNPDDPASAPGRVPPGDSRSLRRGNEFALVYRVGTCVISRTGRLGTRGQWRVVEYPTSSAASNSYAKECSRFVSEGFSDYRD